MKNLVLVFIGIFLFTFEGISQHEGTLTKSNVNIGNCSVSSISVKYKIGHFFGEPTVNGVYKVSGSSDCSLPSSTTIWIKIKHSAGGYGYIRLSPTVPKMNGDYGYNFTGSPNWDEFICGYSGSSKTECFDTEDAKTLYKEGQIVGFEISW